MKDSRPNTSDRKLYQFIEKYYHQHGYAPSMQEMVDNTPSKSKGHISPQLDNLEKAGWIERTPNIPRGIHPLKRARQTLPPTGIPLLGVIQAGAPIPLPNSDFAMFLPEDSVDVGNVLPDNMRRKQIFALRVKGDSMVDANIQENDIVIMLPVSEASNGDLIAAWLPQEESTTLKKYYWEEEHKRIRLQPANPAYEPIYRRPNQVRVQGRVVMVVRNC